MLRVACLSAAMAACIAAAPAPTQAAGQGLPHYRVIDYGTLGGPNSFYFTQARGLNSAGTLIYQAETAVPDPVGTITDGLLVRGIAAHTGVRDLGTPAGHRDVDNSFPAWIADNGMIAGIGTNGAIDPLTGFPEVRGILWQGTTAVPLGTLGGNGSQALAVNNRAQVVGVAFNAQPDDLGSVLYGLPAATQARAFLWVGGRMRDLGTLGGANATAFAINDAGQVVGNSFVDGTVHDATGLPTVHPFLWGAGRMRDLGTLGGTLSAAGPLDLFGGAVLNRRGDVAGSSTLAGDEAWHAFLWSGDHLRDLGTLGGFNSEAWAINDNGDVVGRADFSEASDAHHAFFWRNGRMADIGTLPGCANSTAVSVNSQGQAVGLTGRCTGARRPRGFLSQAGAPMVDLNTLVVDDGIGITVTEAWYINDAGAIAAIGLLPSGDEHAVLLMPTATPGVVVPLQRITTPAIHATALDRGGRPRDDDQPMRMPRRP